MKKWKVLVAGNDGRNFFLHYHVIAPDGESAKKLLRESLIRNDPQSKPAIREVEELEDAALFLPGVVFKSGRAYFDT